MVREFINPNLHVALVHFPLGLLIAGTLIELFSFMWRRHALRAAGRWMILLGALSGIPAATSGIYALADVSRMGVESDVAAGTWKEVAAASPLWNNPEQAHLMRDHVVLQSWATSVAVLVSVLFLGASDRWRVRLHLPLLALLLISMGLAVAGAWHAGEAVYRHGTGVEIAPSTQPSLADLATAAVDGAAVEEQAESKRGVEYYLPPLQAHTIGAGVVIAVALGALGLSMRASSQGIATTQVDNIAAALGVDEPPERVRVADAHARVPSARFWLLACLLALLTAAGGIWVMTGGSEWNPARIWELMREGENPTRPWLTRRVAHAAGGASIAVLALILSLLAWGAPRSRVLLFFFSVLLLGVVAAQVWLGILLLYDTMNGPVTGFN